MKRLFIQLNVAILLLLSFSFHCMGVDTYTLEYNLEKGKTYNQNMVSVMKMEVMGMNISVTAETGIKYDVLGQNNGVFDISASYKKFKMNMQGQMPLVIDSDSPEKSTDAAIGNAIKSLIGVPFDIKLTKQGKITSIKGTEKLAEKINSMSSVQFKEIFAQQYSEKSIQATFEQMMTAFPAKPVAIGESWDANVNIVQASGIDIISKLKLTLKQVKDNVATINCVGILSTPEGGGVLSMQDMEAKVSVRGEQTGTILIDMKTGWIISSEINQKFVQDMEAMGQTMQQKIETKATVTAD